jgi:hypothetical protein
MTAEQRKVMESHIAQIHSIANRAEELQSHVGDSYSDIMQKEIEGYRELIAIWRKRLDSE